MLSSKLHPLDNGPFATSRTFLEIIGVSVSDDTLRKSLESHSDFPSLLSLKDVFLSFGINSTAVQTDDYNLSDFQTPFICPIQKNGWDSSRFILIKSIDNEIVTFYNTVKSSWEKVALNVFREWHTGVVLLAEKNGSLKVKSQSANESIPKKLVKSPWFLFFVPVLFALIYGLERSTFTQIWFGSLSLILNITGLTLSLLLIWHDVDHHNPFLKRICSNGQKTDCGSILQSNGAKAFGINWSTIGFSYFLTNSLSHIFFGLSNTDYLVVWVTASITASPFIIYSVIYQWRIIKKWCLLCLAVQAIMSTQLMLNICYLDKIGSQFKNIIGYPVFVHATLFALIITATVSFLSILKKASKSSEYQLRWQRLKSDPEIFRAQLISQQSVSISTDGVGVVLGNLDAKHEIVMVSNPYCAPCSIAHNEINSILNVSDNVRFRIIFSVSMDESDFRSPPVRHIMAIDILGEKLRKKKAIDDWYSLIYKDFTAFTEAYPVESDPSVLDEKIRKMYNWCHEMGVRHTPTIYFDGFLLPDSYEIGDLINFV